MRNQRTIRLLIILFTAITLMGGRATGQNTDSLTIAGIFGNALSSTDSYENLRYLTEETPGRMLGSDHARQAIAYMAQYLRQAGADTVYCQHYTTPAWSCSGAEVSLLTDNGQTDMHAVGLGPSPATPRGGTEAEVIMVNHMDELQNLSPEQVSGKIVFFNQPWDQRFINPFNGYGDAVQQRAYGPARAAKLGAVGAIVRSVTTSMDTVPHSGSTHFDDIRIPAVAISTLDANLLSEQLAKDPGNRIRLTLDSRSYDSVQACNLIAEINGKTDPQSIITIGGHIDSWQNTPGAHDDGAGCVMSADLIRLFTSSGFQNRHTIRVVLFMDEELYQSGGRYYAAQAELNGEDHLVAIETDAGAFSPRFFSVDAPATTRDQLAGIVPMLRPYGITEIKSGWGGVDIGPLKAQGIPLIGYGTDPQRYFDLHHSANDHIGTINRRELQLGTGCLGSLVYLLDMYPELVNTPVAP